jgi:uncharacterized membrane protein YkvA (DUF1232 family)
MSHKDEFIGFMSRSIVEIHQDVKVIFEMLDDAELNDETRMRAAGAMLYLLAPGDLIPDTFGLLGHADDSLILRMMMAYAIEQNPERSEHYRERFPEVFDTLEPDLESASRFLGELYPWMFRYLDRLREVEYKGKRAELFVNDIEASLWLYNEVNEDLLDLEFDDDELQREVAKVEKIIPILKEKMNASRR